MDSCEYPWAAAADLLKLQSPVLILVFTSASAMLQARGQQRDGIINGSCTVPADIQNQLAPSDKTFTGGCLLTWFQDADHGFSSNGAQEP